MAHKDDLEHQEGMKKIQWLRLKKKNAVLSQKKDVIIFNL